MGVAGDYLFKVGDGRIQFSSGTFAERQFVTGKQRGRIGLKRALDVGPGVVQIAAAVEYTAQMEIGVEIVGMGGERFAEIGLGALFVGGLLLGDSESGVQTGKAGIETRGGLEILAGRHIFVQLEMRFAGE